MSSISSEFADFVRESAGNDLRTVFEYCLDDEEVGDDARISFEYIRPDLQGKIDREFAEELGGNMAKTYRLAQEKEDLLDSEMDGVVELYDDFTTVMIPYEQDGVGNAAVISIDREVSRGSNIDDFVSRGSYLL